VFDWKRWCASDTNAITVSGSGRHPVDTKAAWLSGRVCIHSSKGAVDATSKARIADTAKRQLHGTGNRFELHRNDPSEGFVVQPANWARR